MKEPEATGFDRFGRRCGHAAGGIRFNIIAKTVSELAIDLLIVGAYSHSPWRSMLVGSKTTDLLRSAKIPTLLLR